MWLDQSLFAAQIEQYLVYIHDFLNRIKSVENTLHISEVVSWLLIFYCSHYRFSHN